MGEHLQPLVSVVTPVFNGEKYLAECIESVLAQTYENWEYVIVDNCSTDRTMEIAQMYQRRDARIHVNENREFLPHISNWNRALRQITTDCKYCKVVHADDQLFPDCLTRMVEVAEANPSVGIVGAYRLDGKAISLDGFPSDRTVVSGREICRSSLLGGPYVFGTPTSLLIASDVIRSREAFYNESILHADSEACYDVLRTSDFAFVHEVLTYTRRHDRSVTHRHRSLDTLVLDRFLRLRRYGPEYLSEEEYRYTLKRNTTRYYRFLTQQLLQGKLDVWRYHRRGLEQSGVSLSASYLAEGFAWLLIRRLLDAARTLKAALKRVALSKG